jgi:hypothetical protein
MRTGGNCTTGVTTVVLLTKCNSGEESRMRNRQHMAHMEKTRHEYRLLVGKTEQGEHLRRPRHRWDSNIKVGLHEMR